MSRTAAVHIDIEVTMKGDAEDIFWRIANTRSSWLDLLWPTRRLRAVLPGRQDLSDCVEIDHSTRLAVTGVIPASIWHRDTTLQVCVYRHNRFMQAGYLTFLANKAIYQFGWDMP